MIYTSGILVYDSSPTVIRTEEDDVQQQQQFIVQARVQNERKIIECEQVREEKRREETRREETTTRYEMR